MVAKLSVAGESATKGPVPPVPLSVALWGLPTALSVIVSVPVAAPDAVGAKVTLTVQEELAARVAAQLFVSANGALALIFVIESVALPELVTVTT